MEYKGFTIKEEDWNGTKVVCIYKKDTASTARTFSTQEAARLFVDAHLYPADKLREHLKKNRKLTLFVDPGHSWLRVQKDLIDDLGLTNKITNFSYFDSSRELVYLEEHEDVSTFVNKIKELGFNFKEEFEIKKSRSQSPSFIRRLPSYS